VKTYKYISLILMFLFAVTGILFLGFPEKVLSLFNSLSSPFGMPQSPLIEWNFYLILSAGYMYLVSVLAFLMFRHPGNHYFPLLLIHAKLASSILSLAFFLLHSQYLIYLVNFIVDGVIGVIVLSLYFKMRRTVWAYS
jgi:hypothetical protein